MLDDRKDSAAVNKSAETLRVAMREIEEFGHTGEFSDRFKIFTEQYSHGRNSVIEEGGKCPRLGDLLKRTPNGFYRAGDTVFRQSEEPLAYWREATEKDKDAHLEYPRKKLEELK